MRNYFFAVCAHGVLFGLLIASSAGAFGQCTDSELDKIVAFDGQADDEFGYAVAVSGNVAVIGARLDDDAGFEAGAAYVYRFDGVNWNFEMKLFAGDAEEGDFFGTSVAASGNRIAVGATGVDGPGSQSGAAYVFLYDGANWTEDNQVFALDAAGGDQFGTAVGLAGDTLVVGSPFDDDNGFDSGAAYVFQPDEFGWNQVAKLRALDGAPDDRFGSAAAISGTAILVGAPLDDNLPDSGSAYVFRFIGAAWQQEFKLLPADRATGDQFGTAVALAGDAALIGAHFDDDRGSQAGSAYVFRYTGTTWVEEDKLLAPDGGADDEFGLTVAISGDTALVGVRFDDDAGADAGAAHVFRRNGTTWMPAAKLRASDGAAGDEFANAVALDGPTALIGAHFDDDAGLRAGTAFIFRGLGDCNGNGTLDLCDLVNGTSFDSDGDGIPDECVPELCASSEIDEVLAPDGAAGDWFGHDVALADDWLLVGAWLDDDRGFASGAAYLYAFNGLAARFHTKLVPAELTGGEWFGYSVDIDGDVAVVGAWGDDVNGSLSGSAYVFRYDGQQWNQETRLLPLDGGPNVNFGSAVAIAGNVIVVGAHSDDQQGAESGSAYVFRFNGSTWTQENKLLPPDGAAGDEFGRAVDLSGDWILVGSRFDGDLGTNSGSAYLFRHTGSQWTFAQKLLASDGERSDRFGWSVALDGPRALIGALNDDDRGSNSGSAYLFEYDGLSWSEEVKFVANEGDADDEFGRAVDLSGDIAVISAFRDEEAGEATGSVYAFQFDGNHWTGAAKILASDAEPYDDFGLNLALRGGFAVVGARGGDDFDTDSGSAYLLGGLSDCNGNGTFDLCEVVDESVLDCNGNGHPDTCDLAEGISADENGNAIPDDCDFTMAGDLNCDGTVNNADIPAFVLAVSATPPDYAEYYDQFPDCVRLTGDANGDGVLNNADIVAFVGLLTD